MASYPSKQSSVGDKGRRLDPCVNRRRHTTGGYPSENCLRSLDSVVVRIADEEGSLFNTVGAFKKFWGFNGMCDFTH